MRNQIKWLWENMDAPYRRRHIIALCLSVFTCMLLLVNPALSQRLIDDVIVAQNPDPLLGILAVMLVVKLGREGLRYMMVIFLETDAQNVIYQLRCSRRQLQCVLRQLCDEERLERLSKGHYRLSGREA